MYTLNETAKLIKLIKIQKLIEKFETYLAADHEALQGFASNNVPGFRQQVYERIRKREEIIYRLNRYYAKQVFQLASDTYNRLLTQSAAATGGKAKQHEPA